jgi:hypothetical protein
VSIRETLNNKINTEINPAADLLEGLKINKFNI